jgi:hypothetical protein
MPRWRGRLCRGATWQKGHTGTRGMAGLHGMRGLGGGEGDARTQVLARSAARVPWRQALGHSIAASAAMVCCGA